MNDFYRQVYDIVAQIPRGKVISYGQIARLLCRPRGTCGNCAWERTKTLRAA